MRLIIGFILASLGWYNTCATNYYLSANGNDNNSGTTKNSPWRSLKKLNSFIRATQPGDSIFFERGSIFKGQIDISKPGIYLGAYGSGAKPIISGSIELSQWKLIGKNIWVSDCQNCTSEVNNLFIDGKFQALGRYPNEGYLPLSAYVPTNNLILDESLKFADTYWNGAELVVRSSRWTIDKLPISEYKAKTFYISEKPSYDLHRNFGYFIQKHLSTLDKHGEWFFDFKKKQLYVYFKNSFLPDRHTIAVSDLEIGMNASSASDITVENIVFDKQSYAGIRLKNCTNVFLNKIEILNSGKNGLEIISCKNPNILNCLIADSNNNGLEWQNSSGGKFSHNTVVRTGIHPGQGASGNGTHIALYITSNAGPSENNVIEYNTIDSTGYSAIDFRTGHTSIKNNVISNFCLAKDDGAAVYTWSNSKGENSIEDNTIKNGKGFGDGTVNKDELYASGIYIDDHSSLITVKNNVVSNCSLAGVYFHNAHDIKLIGNKLYGNGNCMGNKEKGQLYIKIDNIGKASDSIPNLEVLQNKLIATNELSYCLFLSANKKDDLAHIGLFSQNQFSAFHADQAVAESYSQFDLCSAPDEFTLNQWQVISQNEKSSTFNFLSKGNFDALGSDLISKDLNGWISWPETSSVDKEKNPATNSYSIKLTIPKEAEEALLYHTGIFLDNTKVYRLTFSAASIKPSKIEFVPLMAQSPWAALGKYACFSVDSTYKTYTYYFRCAKNNVESRLNFKSNSTFWIKDIRLNEVAEALVTTKK